MTTTNAEKKVLTRCDLCEYEQTPKGQIPCLHCTKNRTYKSYYKETTAVIKLKEVLDIKELNVFGDEE